MGLRLHTVPARQGAQWLSQGMALWLRRPLAFTGLFVSFLFIVLLLALVVPVVGGALGLALLPMLTLGFMIASRSALAGGPVHALQLVEGLRTPDRARRRAQWLLCGGYLLGSMLVITLADWVDDGLFVELQRLMAEQRPDGGATAEVGTLLADPRLARGMLVRLGLAGLLSIPYWHAPALVHWGGQGALQSLFSSTLALWRARGAFFVYLMGWCGLMLAAAMAVMALGSVIGSNQLLGVMTMPLGLALSAAFYASLWFGFADSFGAALAEGGTPAPTPTEPPPQG